MAAEPSGNIIFLGKTSAGKTSAINLLLGLPIEDPSLDSATLDKSSKEIILGTKRLMLWDTPGFQDTKKRLKDSDIIKGIEAISNIKTICCCFPYSERITEEIILIICEILHLYNIGLSNIIMLFTKCDFWDEAEEAKYKSILMADVMSKIGWVKTCFIGRRQGLIEEFKVVLTQCTLLPIMNPTRNFVSTSEIAELINTYQQFILKQMSKATSDRALLQRINEINTAIIRKEQSKGFIARLFNAKDGEIEDLNTEKQSILQQVAIQGNIALEVYQKNLEQLKNQKIIRLYKMKPLAMSFIPDIEEMFSEIQNIDTSFNDLVQAIKAHLSADK